MISLECVWVMIPNKALRDINRTLTQSTNLTAVASNILTKGQQ